MQKSKKTAKSVKAEAKDTVETDKKTVAKKDASVKKSKYDKKAPIPPAKSRKTSVKLKDISKPESYSVEEAFPQFKGKKKKFFDLLMRLREQVLSQVRFLSEEAIESKSSELAGSVSNHMADFGSDNFLHDMELHMLSDDGEILEMIDEAIERLKTGDYGKCLECSCKIPEARLEVKPYARYCVKCKTLHENNGDISPG